MAVLRTFKHFQAHLATFRAPELFVSNWYLYFWMQISNHHYEARSSWKAHHECSYRFFATAPLWNSHKPENPPHRQLWDTAQRRKFRWKIGKHRLFFWFFLKNTFLKIGDFFLKTAKTFKISLQCNNVTVSRVSSIVHIMYDYTSCHHRETCYYCYNIIRVACPSSCATGICDLWKILLRTTCWTHLPLEYIY